MNRMLNLYKSSYLQVQYVSFIWYNIHFYSFFYFFNYFLITHFHLYYLISDNFDFYSSQLNYSPFYLQINRRFILNSDNINFLFVQQIRLDCSASIPTSSATTANPLPCSPALAASIAAFKSK